MTFRFVHAADLHLDSPLRSLALRDPALAELIGGATRQAFERLVDLCLAERVDALLLAGDLYDGEQSSMKTARLLAGQLRRLDEAGIRVFIIQGNHDAQSPITKQLILPDSVTLFGGRAGRVEIEPGGMPVAIHGISFTRREAPDSLVPKFGPPVEGAVNIGMLHTSLGGSPGHDTYAPCSPGELRATGFRYWALGHIHVRSVDEGACTIVMPGMPQGRDINEAGPKSATLVTVGDDGGITLEEHRTSIAEFQRVPVDLTQAEDWGDLPGLLSRALERTRDAAASEHLVARLELTGATPLAWRARRDADILRVEAAERAEAVGGCWIDKLEIGCTPPAKDEAGLTTSGADPSGELQSLIEDEILASPGFREQAARIAEELRGQLPAAQRENLLGADETEADAALDRLARLGAGDVMAALRAVPADGPIGDGGEAGG